MRQRGRNKSKGQAKDHVEAVNPETDERFNVRGEDIDGMAVELAGVNSE